LLILIGDGPSSRSLTGLNSDDARILPRNLGHVANATNSTAATQPRQAPPRWGCWLNGGLPVSLIHFVQFDRPTDAVAGPTLFQLAAENTDGIDQDVAFEGPVDDADPMNKPPAKTNVERTSAGLQMILPGCERRTLPKSTSRVDEGGQGLLHFYQPPSLREQLETRSELPLRSNEGAMSMSGLFGS